VAHFSDLSFYQYGVGNPPQTKNVGWLERGHDFEMEPPSMELLDALWPFCKVSVMQTRGLHRCDLCVPSTTVSVVRDGFERLLGSAEIRVLSKENPSTIRESLRSQGPGLVFLRKSLGAFDVYAAPNLIYHYVEVHHYKPPHEFLDALKEGLKPPDREYFARLEALGLEWREAAF
jgi:hypothetical protein